MTLSEVNKNPLPFHPTQQLTLMDINALKNWATTFLDFCNKTNKQKKKTFHIECLFFFKKVCDTSEISLFCFPHTFLKKKVQIRLLDLVRNSKKQLHIWPQIWLAAAQSPAGRDRTSIIDNGWMDYSLNHVPWYNSASLQPLAVRLTALCCW